MKIEELDNLLLFLSSFLALFFTVFQLFLNTAMTIIYFAPLLVLGAILPIYVGYIRGALIYDSVPERVRGWVYFILGVPFYLFATVGRAIGLGLLNVNGISLLTVLLLNVIIMILIMATLLILIFKHNVIVRTLFHICGHKVSNQEDKAILRTSLTAMLLGIVGYYLVISATETNIFSLVAIIVFVIVFYLGESSSQKKLFAESKKPLQT